MTASVSEKRIALAHDFLTTWGGAERVFKVMTEMYPEAPIYTLFYDSRFTTRYFPGREIRATFLQKFPQWLRNSHWLLPLYPVAVETLDLRNFDIVFSSSGAWMKGLVTRLYTRHITYLHSPMRFVWDTYHEHPGFATGLKFFKRLVVSYLRIWDKEAAARPDVLLVNSEYTNTRIKKYYQRRGEVVYPPLVFPGSTRSLSLFRATQPFIVVGRLTKTKQVEIIIEAFNRLKLPLLIIGRGREEGTLRARAQSNITFLGAIDDTQLEARYRGARALIQASQEDFGMVAIEALAFGVPVIAYSKGGAREVVIPGQNGEFFESLTPEAIIESVRRCIEHETEYSIPNLVATVRASFSRQRFEDKIRTTVENT